MDAHNGLFGPIIRTSLVIMLLCGIIYPLAATGVAQALMQEKADGSLLYNEENKVVGSSLIGQTFSSPEYFQGRVSSIEYNGAGSGSNNYAPSNEDLKARLTESVEVWKQENPETPLKEVPGDLITNSGSGLDPHISPEAALAQVDRIADARNMDKEELVKLVEKHTDKKTLGVLGEERVNVLELNLELSGQD